MHFSIVIPAYNEGRTIAECIGAIRHQKNGFEYEIIVVDNNSTDNTAKVAHHLGVQVIMEKRQGVGWARRTGTQHAHGDYVLHIDADTRLPENYLYEVLYRFEHDSSLVCLGGQMYYYDAPWWKNFLRFFVHWGLWVFAVVISRGTVGPMGNNMTFRKSIYDKTEGFCPLLRYGEDMDLSRKLSKFGKVKLDMSLSCYVSIRRFKVNKQLFVYFLNFLKMSTVGTPYHNALPHADEK